MTCISAQNIIWLDMDFIPGSYMAQIWDISGLYKGYHIWAIYGLYKDYHIWVIYRAYTAWYTPYIVSLDMVYIKLYMVHIWRFHTCTISNFICHIYRYYFIWIMLNFICPISNFISISAQNLIWLDMDFIPGPYIAHIWDSYQVYIWLLSKV